MELSVSRARNDVWVGWQQVVAAASRSTFPVEEKDLTGKWCLLTGGNLGIGIELARALVRRGCSVIVASRPGKPGDNKEKQVEDDLRSIGLRAGQEVHYWPLDAERLDSVKSLADRWLKTGRPLDLLVGNHGIAVPELDMVDGFERTYVINFLSHAYLSLLLLPALARAKSPRIINSGSCFHYFGSGIDWDRLNSLECDGWMFLPPFLKKYGESKLLMTMFNAELAIRLGSTEKYRHIIPQTVHPGIIATRLFSDLYSWAHPFRTVGAFGFASCGISATNGANALLKACVSDDDERAVRGGQYFHRAWPREARPEVYDAAARRKLWDRVLKECKLSESVLQ